MARWTWAKDTWTNGTVKLVTAGIFILVAKNKKGNRHIWVEIDEKDVKKLIKELEKFLEIRERAMTRYVAEQLDEMFRKIEGGDESV